MKKLSDHKWTFSKWIPHFEFKESSDVISKCPNCESDNYLGDYCPDCEEWYSNKEKIFQIIEIEEEKDTMTPEEIRQEKKYINDSKHKYDYR